MNKDNVITIGFNFVGEDGESYSATSTVEVFHSLGETAIDVIGDQLSAFLVQIGFPRKYGNIFMEDISDVEYDALSDFLESYRKDKGNQ